MKSILIIGGKLTAICAFAAIVLGFVNSVTEPVIEENKHEALEAALNRVAGESDVGKQVQVDEGGAVQYYYPIEDPDGGYIVKLIGTGYGGDMHILAGFKPDGEVFSIVLMENQETPGLGKKAENPEYMGKFIAKGDDEPIPTRKDQLPQEQADAVTGATITFIGIASALEEGSNFVQSLGDSK